MEKIINISLTKEGSKPEGSVSAGFRGEHKATALVFTPDSELLALIRTTEAEGFEVVCRTDFALPSGEYFKGAEKEIEKISEPFYLTAPMTLSGLDGIAILSLLKKSGGEVVSELFKAQVRLSFEDSGLPYTPQAETENNKPTPDLAAFEQRVSEITELMEGKVAAVKGFADRSAAQLSRTVALADSLEQKTAEVEEKLQKGEFDGRDADTSAVANAVKGLAEGVGLEITDLSPLPHQVNLSLDKNLLAGTTFTDLPHIGYCRSDKTYPLVKGVSYLLKVKTKSGKQPLVVIELPEWTSKTSPGYCFEASDTYSFDAFFSFDHLALFINLPAEDVLSAEICAAGDENLANLPVSVTADGETQVYYTDQKGTVSFPSSSDMSLSAGKFYAIRASYNKDINKAFPTAETLEKLSLKPIKTIVLSESAPTITVKFDKPLRELYVRFRGRLDISANISSTLCARCDNGSQYFFWGGGVSFYANQSSAFIFHSREVVPFCWETDFPSNTLSINEDGIMQGISAHTQNIRRSYSTRMAAHLSRFVNDLDFFIKDGANTFAVGSVLEIYGVEVE